MRYRISLPESLSSIAEYGIELSSDSHQLSASDRLPSDRSTGARRPLRARVWVFVALVVLAGTGLTAASAVPQPDTHVGGGADTPTRLVTSTAENATTRASVDTDPDSAAIDPDAVDTDGDGLTDTAEIETFGTDPNRTDTDGDGYPDGMEVRCARSLPDADPLRTDIYVEVDAAEPEMLSADVRRSIRETFADAPVSNPDGSTGIDIHLITNDTALSANGTVYSQARDGPGNDIYDFRSTHFDHRDAGYYYVLLADDVAYAGEDYYVGAGRPGIAALEPFDSTRTTASLFMHELGHAMGLGANQDGIDEERYTRTEYDSVMNYNGLYKQLTYSNGTDSVGRDEWQFVAENRTQPDIQCAANGTCASRCPLA